MAIPTWKNMSGLSAGNSGSLGYNFMNNAFDSVNNLAKTIQQDRSKQFDSDVMAAENNIRQQLSGLNAQDPNYRQQAQGIVGGLDPRFSGYADVAGLNKAAQDNRSNQLANAQNLFKVNNQQAEFDLGQKAKRAQIANSNMGLQQKQRAMDGLNQQDALMQHRNQVVATNPNISEADLRSEMNKFGQQQGFGADALGTVNQTATDIFSPTQLQAAKAQAKKDQQKQTDAIELQQEKNKKSSSSKTPSGSRFANMLERNPSAAAMFSDVTDSDYLEAAKYFNSDLYKGSKSGDLDAILSRYIDEHGVTFPNIDDQDFDVNTIKNMLNTPIR